MYAKPIIAIINGPNMNLIGVREPEIYGNVTFEDYVLALREQHPDVTIAHHQSNHEGGIIDLLHHYGFLAHGIILNPGGYTHTSIAIADAVRAISTPVIEVHISDIYSREDFRRVSFIEPHCRESIIGKGLDGYKDALLSFKKDL